ncbi:hypothetical protein jhhlp_002407 [Lomentospora prolificans]|uniref:Crossover junction endonuclease MUS81 n=1 Tax=Lomentospora prolificans TaxID=41688 RepID=A0A2N3NE65_9PEZI|nr:hypothetical protein jhhlp_002407 [Lomentospora prolificans]
MDDPEHCANPLLLKWVKEWLDFAREKNTRGVLVYKHAYDALKSCPITFQHPSQLQQLRGFGPKLCQRLTDKLKAHCEENGLPMPRATRQQAVPAAQLEIGTEETETAPPPRKPRKKKPYVPSYRSGAYAIIVALSTLNEHTPGTHGLTKARLIELAQPMCDSSFTAPSDVGKFYTAWNSMRTLIEKDLVYEKGRPMRTYTLTDEGWEVADRLKAVHDPNQLNQAASSRAPQIEEEEEPFPQEEDDITILDDVPSPRTHEPHATGQDSTSMDACPKPGPPAPYRDLIVDYPTIECGGHFPTFSPIQLAPGSFTVELLLDVREIRATKDRDYLQEELIKQGVRPIMRSLDLGDAQWVARCNDPALLTRLGAEGEEVVLDWIVERKRLDDLVASIKDGRFHEQKFRLRKSGVKNVIYIVEEISMDAAVYQRVEDAVTSAMAQIQVVNGYFLKRTQTMDQTIRYLARMTQLLRSQYEGRRLQVIPTNVLTAQNYLPLLENLRANDPQGGYYVSYPAFSSLASKSDMLTLRDIFLKMLMTTRGVTGEKAIEIQKRWKTPYNFIKAFEACGHGEAGKKRKRELVMTELDFLMVPKKKIGKHLSERIAEVWGDA